MGPKIVIQNCFGSHKISGPKNFSPKNFWSKKFLWFEKKNFRKEILVQKIGLEKFSQKENLVLKRFLEQFFLKIFVRKKICFEKEFWPEKKILSQKNFWSENNFGQENFLVLIFLFNFCPK